MRRRTKQQPVNVIKKKVRKNVLKTLDRAENEGHQEYLKLLLYEVNNKQTRLKRLRETRRRTKQQPVNVIKKKVRQQPVNVIKKKKVRKNLLKTLVRAENEGHQEYWKLLLNEVNNKQTRLKRLRETRRRTIQQPVNVIKKKVRQQPVNVIKKKKVRTRLIRLRETRRRTKQQPVNVIKKKVRKNVLKTLDRAENEGHQEYLKLLLYEVNNKQTRLKRLRETRRRTKQQPVNVIKKKVRQQPVNVIKKKKVRVNNKQTRLKRLRERRTKQQPVNVIKKKVRQQPVNVIKKKKVRKNLLKTLVRAENEGHQEYLKLLLNEVNNKQTRLKRLRETRRRTIQQPVNVIKKKVRKNVLKTLDRAENEGHQEYLKLLLYEVNNKQTRLKRLRETRRRTKQQPVNVIKKKVRKNLLKTLVRAENEGHQEYLKLLLNEIINKQTRLKRLRETRRRTKQQPVNVIKKKVRKNLLKTLVRAENEGHQEYLKLLLNEIINKQTRLKRLRETRRRTKQQPVNVIKKKVRTRLIMLRETRRRTKQQRVNVIKKKVRKNLLKTLVRAENEGHQEYLKLLLNEVNNKQTRLIMLRETRRRTKQQPVNVIKKKVRKNVLKTLVRAENEGHQEYLKLLLNEVNNKQTRLKRLRETRRTKQQPVNVIKKKVRGCVWGKNVLKTLVRAENEGHQEYLKLLLNEIFNKQTRLIRLRETRRRTKQQPVNVIKKKVRKNLLKTLVRAENEGHQEYLKLLLNEVNNKQTRLKRLRKQEEGLNSSQ
ncbi:hypothetical protein J6590_104862 [Homalodisca vitripennis]|nr:hypothetical protein J6590_104862 [Homalodisca vitripennis]